MIPRKCNVNFTSSAELEDFDVSQCHTWYTPNVTSPRPVCNPLEEECFSYSGSSGRPWAQAAEECSRWHGFLPESDTTRPGEWSGVSLKHGYIQSDVRGYSDVFDALKRSELLLPEAVPGQNPNGHCFYVAPPPSTKIKQGAANGALLYGGAELDFLRSFRQGGNYVLYSTSCTDERNFSCALKYEQGFRTLSPCPRGGWLDWDSGNKCLWVNYTRTSFETAHEVCASFGGQLATFKGRVSYLTTIVLLLQKEGGPQKSDTYWMGLKKSPSGKYEWIDGKPLTTPNWHPRTDYKEQAGQIHVNRYFLRHPLELRWSLGNPASRLPFICEIPLKTGNAWLRVQMTREEQGATFQCFVSPEILPDSIVWYKDGLGVKGNRLQTGLDDAVLMEVSATREHPYLQGYYWCEGITVDGFRRVESRKQLLRFSDVKSLACSLQLTQEFMHIRGYPSLRSFLQFASQFRNDILSFIQRNINGYLLYELQVVGVVEGTNNTSFVNFLVYLKRPLRLPRSLDPEEERTIVSRISTLLANPASILRTMVVPGTAEVTSTEICFSETTKHDTGFLDTLSWPATAVGSLATSNETCIHEDMRPVVRRCEGNFTAGASWGPVQGVCLMQPSQRTLDLKALSMEEVSSESMGATADRLQQLTTEKRSLDPLDIVYVATTVENIASTGAVSRQVAQDVVTALDNVLNAEQSTLYLSRSANSTNRILGAMEQVSRRLDSDTVVFQRSVALGKISKFQESTLGVAIHLDLEQRYNFVDTRNLTQGTDVAFVFSKSNQFQLDRELNIGVMGASSLFEDSFQPTDDESSELAFEICSSVLLANYENEEVDNVREPFSIYFKQSCDVTPVEVECVFWDPSENYDLGAWSTAGCEYIGLERGYHVCNCSHLTSFAVLFRHNDRSKRSPHDHILSYLTFIGIALSALGLLMVVFTYICHKRWRKGVGHQILMHLSVALLGALGAYLALVTVPVPRTGPALCACIGGLLHYLLLVSFCWTFVEALLQYLRFVKVLGTYVPNLVLKAALAAWGFPAVIVIAVLVINPGHYNQRAHICWLGKDILLYSFLAPVATILFANCVVFGVVIFSIYCRRHKELRSSQSQAALAKAQLRATICIVFLLGLTWIFAYLSLLEEASRSWGRLFEYLFVASSSLQGFVIFLFHVAYEKTAREFWLGNLVYKVLPTSRKRSFDQTMSKNTLSSTGQKTTST
ncbi:adhesion G-protein coupled receptor G2 [Ixodes scapularis]